MKNFFMYGICVIKLTNSGDLHWFTLSVNCQDDLFFVTSSLCDVVRED